MRASATHGAVTPIAMSPNPAGQANRPGRTPCAWRARKPNPPGPPSLDRGQEPEVGGKNQRPERAPAKVRSNEQDQGNRRAEENRKGWRLRRPDERPVRTEEKNQREPDGKYACDEWLHRCNSSPQTFRKWSLTLITHPPLPRADKGL